MTTPPAVEKRTGDLYSDLWGPYGQQLFEQSVALFEKRLNLAGVPTTFFAGKQCLDAGCGGGRNSIAMARLKAAKVIGVDVGEGGLDDARRRAGSLTNVEFRHASVLELPFADAQFDVVWCAGVIMHTANPERALDELTRVLKPGGALYLLVYASEGLRWPLIQLLRPLAQQLGQPALDRAVAAAELPANKRRTFLDDLFVPCIDFFRWDRLKAGLERRGLTNIDRWGHAPRLDQEQSLEAYRTDLASLLELFRAGERTESGVDHALFVQGRTMVEATLRTIEWFEQQVHEKALSNEEAMARVIGQGHHRVWCTRGGR
ncbi:MAG: class I SAM-dependent methyltransferase [Myxococcaceae bacterium]|nr:class I SAM-dependent methyltransferase [Myxococcaceae bacterium]